ncbi:MAG: hypothetical protein IH606_09690 [Burkholderiales bacterium]|nr:hypothetical protein [Burkholderiales bacterium]
MALTLPKPALDKKQLPAIVGGVIVLAAAGWFGWQYFNEAPPPPAPISKPQPVTAAKPKVKVSAPSPADVEKAHARLIEDVLAASGLKQQLDQLPQTMAASVRPSGKPQKKAAPALNKAIEDALAEAFAAGEFHTKVSANLKKNYDQKRLQALLGDFSTPTAKRMIEMERASAAPEERARYARSAAATKPSPQRVELIKRIDAATRASDLAVEAASSSVNALASAMAGDDARRSAAIDRRIEKQRSATAQKIRNATLLNLAFGYKDASDADLEKFAGIYETQNSKWLYGLVYASLLEEVKVASAGAAKRIGELAIKPAATAQKLAGAMAGADARACLRLETNTAIIKCAEAYR